MKIDTEKLERLAAELAKDVSGYCSEASATIGCVNGVWFRLVALDSEEAETIECDTVMDAHNCILP